MARKRRIPAASAPGSTSEFHRTGGPSRSASFGFRFDEPNGHPARSGPFPRGFSFLARLPILVVVVAVFLAACVSAPPEVTSDDPELQLGREIYARTCASCHGASGDGAVGLKLSEGAAVEAFPGIEDQIALVAEGRNNMPAFGDRLSEEEQRAVARYVREVL